MKNWLKNSYILLNSFWNKANGNDCYQKYLSESHKSDCHKDPQKYLSKKDFFVKKQQEKWNKINRCC